MTLKEPKLCSQHRKDTLKKQTQKSALNQFEERVRTNKAVADIDDLHADGLEVV